MSSPRTSNILIAIPCLLCGGTEYQTLNLVRALVGGGYAVTVCCYFEHAEEMVGHMRAAGAEVVFLSEDGKRPASYVARILRIAIGLRRQIRRLKPAVVHVQYLDPGSVPVLLCKLFGARRILATAHIPGHVYGRKAAFTRFLARGVTDMFICVSESAERAFFKGDSALLGTPGNSATKMIARGRKHCTIHNAVDVDAIQRAGHSTGAGDWDPEYRSEIEGTGNRDPSTGSGPSGEQETGKTAFGSWGANRGEKAGAKSEIAWRGGMHRQDACATLLRKELGIGEDAFVIGAVARLGYEKGIDILLDAMPAVLAQAPHALLVVVGDGAERANLEQQARVLGIADHVQFLGRQSREKTFALYHIMDIVVVPSRFEGFGLTAIEAMAAGCPVVASNVDGLREVLGDDGSCGALFASEDIHRLSAAILDLIGDPEALYQKGRNARARAESLFSLRSFCKKTLNLYGMLQDHTAPEPAKACHAEI